MNVYLAAAYGRKNELRSYRAVIEESTRWRVVSSWLDEPEVITSATFELQPELGLGFAHKALHDIQQCRRIVVFTGDLGRGGHQLEQGFAMALGLEVIVVGPMANLFSLLATRRFETWTEFVEKEMRIEDEREDDDE